MPVIEKNIPAPNAKINLFKHSHFFLNEMEVGDSVLITADEFNITSMRASIRNRNLRARKGEGRFPWTFHWAREEGYPKNDPEGAIRIWRIK